MSALGSDFFSLTSHWLLLQACLAGSYLNLIIYIYKGCKATHTSVVVSYSLCCVIIFQNYLCRRVVVALASASVIGDYNDLFKCMSKFFFSSPSMRLRCDAQTGSITLLKSENCHVNWPRFMTMPLCHYVFDFYTAGSKFQCDSYYVRHENMNR